MPSRLILLLAGAMLAVATPALAQDEEAIPNDRNTLTVALGGAIVPTYEGSDEYRLIPGGLARGKVAGHNFYTRGLQLYFDALAEGPGETVDISLGPVVGLRLSRTGDVKDARVNALGRLDTAYEVGGFVGIAKTGVLTSAYDSLGFRLSYLADVGDAHRSHVVTSSIEYATPLSRKAFAGLSLSADFVGRGYARYYFDVSPAGSLASGLSPFRTDGGGFKSWSVGLLGGHALSGDLLSGGLSLVAIGSYSRLRGDFARSPVVSEAGSPNQWFGALALAYTF